MPITSEQFAAPAADGDGPINLIGMNRAELTATLETLDEPRFRADQLFKWIYGRGATEFDQMTNLSKTLRAKLADRYVVARPQISQDLSSNDGTHKWLLRLDDGNEVECVHIPESDRGTLCVSSQVGCTLNCRFCHTGTQRLVRNLGPAEIVGQIMLARDHLGEWPTAERPSIYERELSNIVMMGMGEPLYNFDNVSAALKIAMDDAGIAISRRRITLSTAGVVPLIERCGTELGVNLAVSLHAARNDLRDEIVPINRKYPIEELMAACRDYPGVRNSRRITFEYVMLRGVNDSDADARELVRVIAGIPSKVNLIPFNPWPGAPYDRSTDERIEAFAEIVRAAGYPSPVRTPRGEDIMAACGQLKSESERPSRTATG
ncbi:MAG: 23S rRNA (adenine(2503)-C(2))-methyltransferase RlmN [Rhodospirillaceae bacterium]|jgi:23S rRNA (adenine2503-C2)-methyltransferase|nr:23S rRNA (adenine(2503)-C(2))-methyltransferase RlmN [Rhodospirillaceae bacterium]MBT4773092.1 23S rRNA (adenine(2503)-C(2))-methyltransferase RlmN [Rhodospirillaceae bacterium]MBT5358446.1 23S rRNA (adenine(2503)-C(2))-methyltransferase RlmN [Rhodospirillaceae bacterium]MBT5768484.1 23S rRNA (adenine(2503)-C(2))-methyltransferase RlmN [Rhodospirillaceae bacterium]MBT6308313.1 23S rRNA (adenine(2503)-C(2))-methyltransferase RlmN [Rhodospirillaceae bacterium]